MKKTIFIVIAVILSTLAGYYLMTQLKSNPTTISGKNFSIVVDIPPTYKHNQSGDEITVTQSYGIEISISKEVDDYKDIKLGETVGFRMGKMKIKDINDLIERNTKRKEKVS